MVHIEFSHGPMDKMVMTGKLTKRQQGGKFVGRNGLTIFFGHKYFKQVFPLDFLAKGQVAVAYE